jgi:hypothetical protein
VTTVPEGECAALLALYSTTLGLEWENRTNWLTINPTISPCDWYGVVCAAGHVRELRLGSNRLRGSVPRSVASLTQLTTLLLNDNHVRGDLPPELCDLANTLRTVDLAYNQIAVENERVRACLVVLDPDWAATQTTPPLRLRAGEVATDSLHLSWQPIRYSGDGGFYEISYAITLTGRYTVHGQSADKRADSYLLTGLTPGQSYFVRVRTHTPAHAQQENAQWSAYATTAAVTRAADEGTMLVLVYFPADNDLSPYVDSVLQRLRTGSALNPNVHVLYLADKRGDHNTMLFEIKEGNVRTLRIFPLNGGVDELDLTDPAVLTHFLQAGRAHVPAATRTIVALMGHGSGLMPEFAAPTVQSAATTAWQPGPIPALPRGHPATPGDETTGGAALSTVDYGQALLAATENGAKPFDVLFFDQCFQGNLDVLYEVRQTARVLVASPNYAWLAAPYHQYLAAFAPTATPEALGQAIIRIYQAALTDRDPNNDWYPNAIFWVRGPDIAPIATALNQLAIALRAATLGGATAPILEAARQSDFVDTSDCGRQQFKLGPPDELIGAASFARNLQRAFLNGDTFGVTDATTNLLAALNQVHGLARTGRPYLAPDEFWGYDDTLTIMAPLRRDGDVAFTWRASIYTQTTPLVVKTPLESTATIQQAFASTTDGLWDDFLALWYATPLTPTVGMWCNYTPPVQISREVTETLALAVGGQTNFTFAWSATQHDAATEYWLLARTAEYNWYIVETFPLTQTTYQATPVADGTAYDFRIEARDAEGLIVAASETVSHTAPLVTPDQQLYLPLVRP